MGAEVNRLHSVLVLANSSDPDAGYVGQRLVERGLSLSYAWREAGLPNAVPVGTSAVLLLGSEWSVAHPVAPDVLAAECALVRSARDLEVPVLGLCYGAQVLAHTYGGRVRVGADPEVGLVDIEIADVKLVPPGPWWAFHSDVIDLPSHARFLAGNRCGVQAFELPGAVGVQFHPEVRPTVLEGWLRRFPTMAAAAGASSADLVGMAVSREADARASAHALVDAFLARFSVDLPMQPA